MTYESRILAVLSSTELKNQSKVIRESRMCTATCLSALTNLQDLGLIERFTASVTGRGRKSYLYRKRQGV
ncbi:MAG TPA: hypothetical protein VF491_17650 [Vicinamibacterales bacterium]